MNPYLALFVYVLTVIYCSYRLIKDEPITKLDFFGASLSYLLFGLVWVVEKLTK